MKRGIIVKWADLDNCQNLLLFAQAVNELIFDYSIPSHRLPTLNSHYLCYDAISAIDAIDNHGVPEGTIKPIVEELFYSLKNDYVFENEADSPLKYFVKKMGEKVISIHNPNDLNYNERRAIVYTINRRVFSSGKYLRMLKEKITSIIIDNDEQQQPKLYNLTKSLTSEFVNMGYDQRFIFDTLKHCYFNRKTNVNCNTQIEDFLSSFTGDQIKYTVVVIADNELRKICENFNDVNITNVFAPKTSVPKERTFLSKSNTESYFVFNNYDACDPYSAAESAEMSINLGLSLFRLYDHYFDFDTQSAKFIVYDESGYFTIITPKISAVHRMKGFPTALINEKLDTAKSALASSKNNALALFLSSNLHSLSLKSNAHENQLLDLWAIIECLLDISNANTSDRINQICTYLVPIIKSHYLYSLLEQIAQDIKNYNLIEYNRIIGEVTNEFERIYCVGKYIAFDTFATQRDAFLNNCSDFPLLKIRINKYNAMLKTRGSLADSIENHSIRVRWQLMRAYRNRNLIIHNGDKMPYISLLIENLHSYVDVFMTYVINCFADGHNLNSMGQEMFAKECDWLEKTQNKKKQIIDEIFLHDALLM